MIIHLTSIRQVAAVFTEQENEPISTYIAATSVLVAVWKGAGFAIGRLQVRISAWATSHQGLLSLQSLRGR